MPRLPLARALAAALPTLSEQGRAIVCALACYNGQVGSADHLAGIVGLRNRYQLARLLRCEGLPPFEELTGWARLLHWLLQTEASVLSLHELARREHTPVATCYRLVKRLTGLTWTEVRDIGSGGVLGRLSDRCRPPRRRKRSRAVRLPTPARQVLESPATTPRWSWTHAGDLMTRRFPVDGGPFDVVMASPTSVLVTRLHAAAVDRLDMKDSAPAGSINVGSVPTCLALQRSGRFGYVTNQFNDELGVIDIASGRQVDAIPVPGNPFGVTLSQDERTAYVSTNLYHLHAIRLPRGQIVASLAMSGACSNLLLHPAGDRLYVGTWRGGSVLEIHPGTLNVTREIQLGGIPQGMAVSADGRELFVANQAGWLDVIRLCTGRRVASVNLGGPGLGLALSPDGRLLFVGTLADKILAINAVTARLIKSITIGGEPRRMTFDRHTGMLVVANEAGWVDFLAYPLDRGERRPA